MSTLLLMTGVGAPSIYYGDEVGLPGNDDPDCRRSFPPEEQWDREVLCDRKQLIALRRQYRCLRIGDYQVLGTEGMVYVFARTLPGKKTGEKPEKREEIIVALNVGEESAVTTVNVCSLKSQPSKTLYGEGEVSWAEDNLTLRLPPRRGIILG